MKSRIFLLTILLVTNSEAIDLGSLDTSFNYFGSSVGYEHLPLEGDWGASVFVDDLQRVYVLGQNLTSDRVNLYRFISDGTLDSTNFAPTSPTPGILEFQTKMVNSSNGNGDLKGKVKIEKGNNGAVFIGYTSETCSQSSCNKEVFLSHISESGQVYDEFMFGFDIDPFYPNDFFVDMKYFGASQKLAVTSNVSIDLTNGNDFDFGIALLNVNPSTGEMSLDSGFSTDGLDTCSFNQANHNGLLGDEDFVEVLDYDSLSNHLIIGGSAFEGNGLNSDGWNLAFCEYDFSGTLIRQWSTEPLPDFFVDVELLKDMFYRLEGTIDQGNLSSNLYISGMVVGSGGYDFALTKYKLSESGWQIDTTFGANGNGWTTTSFNVPSFGATDDRVSKMLRESEDGSITVAGYASWLDGGNPFGIKREAVILAKYTPNGLLNFNWGQNKSGFFIHQFNPIYGEGVFSLAIDSVTESLYTVGKSQNFTDFSTRITLAKYHNDLIFASRFED